ncbi:MAG: N-acetylmuramoyl-L-alanine amidase [Bacteroides sp.]
MNYDSRFIRRLMPYCLVLLCCAFGLCNPVAAKEFVVVIDAGHGGHDPGAIGKISKEKNINLKVALKLGGLIKLNCKDVKVVYTRTRDVFIPLDRRAQIANDAKADLFISIHTNALAKNRTAQGASTWTLGLAKSDDNLEVAKRENAVILYESDYETRYAGFNPNSAESYIIFEFMQDKYMSQSVHLASLVQKQFKNRCKRVDRGVHQAGFLVLKASAMPSILVELGFISTPAEERYLNTESGTSTLAEGIYQAFLTYKKEQEVRHNGNGTAPTPNQPKPSPSTKETKGETVTGTPLPQPESRKPQATKPVEAAPQEDEELIFKVQIYTSSTKIATTNKRFQGVSRVEVYKEGKIYKYTAGTTANYDEALRTKRALEKRFKGAFVIAFKQGKRTDIQQAIQTYRAKKQKR